jgi:hypothetical protein
MSSPDRHVPDFTPPPNIEFLSPARMWDLSLEAPQQQPAALLRLRDYDTVRELDKQINATTNPSENNPNLCSYLVLIAFDEQAKAENFHNLFKMRLTAPAAEDLLKLVHDMLWFVDLERVDSWQKESNRDELGPLMLVAPKGKNGPKNTVYGTAIEKRASLGMLLQELMRRPRKKYDKFDQWTAETSTATQLKRIEDEMNAIEAEFKEKNNEHPEMGRGVLVETSDDTTTFYSGQFVNGKKHGPGKEFVRDPKFTICFEGIFSNGDRVYGTLTYPQQHPKYARYEGSFLDGYRHGLGRLTFSSSKVYEGYFFGGQPQGSGTLCGFESVYKGEFQNGLKHGKGIWIKDKKGEKVTIEGMWQNGKLQGPAKATEHDGQVWDIEYDKGEVTHRKLAQS